MKKLINHPSTVLDEALAGFVLAHSDIVELSTKKRIVVRRYPKATDKVSIVSGGGSGHEPMHLGFVGRGMLDVACPGELFTSPTPDPILGAIDAVSSTAGTLLIVKNYAGDVMNFEMAQELSDSQVAMVVIDDDVALRDSSANSGQGHRGVAGTLIVEKMVGAAAERGWTLENCLTLAERTNVSTGSMAVALSSCTVPAAGTPTFTLTEDEIELGVGIHGEPGRERRSSLTASDLAQIFVDSIVEKICAEAGDEVILLCNGLGATPPIELYVFLNAISQRLTMLGIRAVRVQVGTFCTALDMAGASLTLTRLDEELLELWDDPVHTATWQW